MGARLLAERGANDLKTGRIAAMALREREDAAAGRTIAFMDWAMQVPEPKTGPLKFDAFPCQRELYLEAVDDREVVVKKGTQVGMSAFSTRWSLYHADTKGWTGLYVFPTKTDMYDFSTLRIGPMINGSPYLQGRARPDDPDNKGMKGVGIGKVVFRGSESKRGLDSVDCDHIVFDEYDTLDHANIPDAERRISSPLSGGLIRRIGVPSVPDWGIAKLYDESDGRRWFVKCEFCSTRQTIDFFENVNLETAIRECRKCRKSLEGVIADGEWVAERPDGNRPRGYHVTRLILPGVNMSSIIVASKKKNPFEKQVFWNKDIGEEWAAAEGRLSKEAIAAAQSRGDGYSMESVYQGDKLVTMGVDVATTRSLSVRISEHIDDDTKRALWIGEVDRYFERDAGEGPSLEALMMRFGVHMACIDHLPDGRMSRQFAEKFPGRVYLVAYFTPSEKDPQVIKVDDDMAFVSVARTKAIDATFEMIRQQRNHLPADLPEGYAVQMGSLVRRYEEDEVGKKKAFYVRMGDADDYAHAEVYDLVATEVWLHRQIMESLLDQSTSTLDDHIDFERSRLADYSSDDDYYAGGREV